MKRPIVATVLFILFTLLRLCPDAVAQSANRVLPLDGFFRNKGVRLLAECAHPFNTYQGGNYSISGNSIMVEVAYTNGTTETIQCRLVPDGDYFESVRAITGEESLYSFWGLKAILDVVLPSERRRHCLEIFFHKSFADMTPNQLAAVVLTASWWDWIGKPCP